MIKNTIPTYPALLDEEIVPIQRAGSFFPYPVGRKAIERYFRHGIRGVRLETVLIGGRRFSSQEAIFRFLEATNKMPNDEEAIRPMSAVELSVAKTQTSIR